MVCLGCAEVEFWDMNEGSQWLDVLRGGRVCDH